MCYCAIKKCEWVRINHKLFLSIKQREGKRAEVHKTSHGFKLHNLYSVDWDYVFFSFCLAWLLLLTKPWTQREQRALLGFILPWKSTSPSLIALLWSTRRLYEETHCHLIWCKILQTPTLEFFSAQQNTSWTFFSLLVFPHLRNMKVWHKVGWNCFC